MGSEEGLDGLVKLRAKCWAAFGLRLDIASTAAELSVKKAMWLI